MKKTEYVQEQLLEEEKYIGKDTLLSINRLLSFAYDHNHAVAAWRDSGKDEIHLIIDATDEYNKPVDPELESLGSGFLVSPFFNDSNHLSYLIKAGLHFTGNRAGGLYLKSSADGPDIEQLKDLYLYSNDSSRPKYYHNDNPGLETGEADFQELVRTGIQEIREGRFQKVVPSRMETVNLREDFNLSEVFLELTCQYPDAFVSFFSLPGKGTWLGASPEILIEVNDQGLFRTSAVAGTQAYDPGTDLSDVAWTQKEIEEQALVSRYIINNFKKIRLREFQEFGPRTIRAGNLVHLRTDFSVNTIDVNFPQLGSVMLKLLHPTSAVCGMPKEPAMDFLRNHENYEREFYSGFLGPVNIDDRTTLYVNLRCAQLSDKKAILYSGAGVTLDSKPEREFRETQIKIKAMKELLS